MLFVEIICANLFVYPDLNRIKSSFGLKALHITCKVMLYAYVLCIFLIINNDMLSYD